MKTILSKIALAAMTAALASGAAAASVTFVAPETFTDAPRTQWDRDPVFKDLKEHVERLAATLPQGRDLHVEFLDIDLAGEVPPGDQAANMDARIVRSEVDLPRFKLRYTLTEAGKVVASGEDSVSNITYKQKPRKIVARGENLRHERQMLGDWFKDRIASR